MKKSIKKATLKLIRTKPYIPATILIVLFIILGAVSSSFKDYPWLRSSHPSSSPTPISLYDDFHLVIPSLEIDAPIIADVDGTDKEAYFAALENGVAHFKGTAKPGMGSNIFIFGHSSFYWYKPGNYKEIFKTLPDLTAGDEIILWYQSKEHRYKVTETKVVAPDEIDVLQPTPQEQVTLMTCVPPGTTLKRLIVIGKPF